MFEANLKTETELWNLVIKEMWAGRKMADQHKVQKTQMILKQFNRCDFIRRTFPVHIYVMLRIEDLLSFKLSARRLAAACMLRLNYTFYLPAIKG